VNNLDFEFEFELNEGLSSKRVDQNERKKSVQ